jgi:hypothetical protein
MTYLDELYSSLLVPLTELCGLRPATEDVARRRQGQGLDERPRTSWHEAGHALVALVAPGVDFALVEMIRGRGALVHSRDAISRETGEPPLETRIAVELGGLVAEETAFGDVDPDGGWTDMVVALARAGITLPEAAGAHLGGVRLVRDEVERLRRLFDRQRSALDCLGERLLLVDTLTRSECVHALRGVGFVAPEQPKYEWSPPSESEERLRVLEAGRQVVAMKARWS